ncbi:FAD-dependent monooxygenase [Ralstonia solanacearum]|uniref:FAD-dependent oxidoreductase n=1 Tax=Ralstonia solanacearum TaxID=305 RepID=UPI0005C50A5F|nr:NAD(P)/FAD-dependent oxidoreductase [Ralstonia solanacearum]MBB6591987.1 FAD-dependent monooxygenase [Ralstonia solanacearum]MBB6596210.1 FAD-dependent monooxygenase [Ralstonia solanacearum]MDB0542017.1 FAD-dependent monooxygenase [Ralstonia solanacearum]MDB0552315.1 FAD-dependent monooxygenase [Ralstonia solanacearum]MDB0556919.1 FAD-dependent monooxygenase [Ralstonia solanacearum]
MTALRPLSIGIAGAGNAGLAAAIAFARQGHDVRVFEKHPQLTAMGAGLLIQPQGIRALEALGLGRELEGIGAPIDRLLGLSHRGWRLVDVDLAGVPGRAVTRAALSNLLFDAARRAGAAFSFGCGIRELYRDGAKARVVHAGGESIFDLFVIADGAASTLREQAGLAGPSSVYRWGTLWFQAWVDGWDPRVLQQRFRGTREMMGLLPTDVEGHRTRLSMFWSLRSDALEAWRQTDIGQWKQQVLRLWPQSAPIVEQIRTHADLPFAVYRHTWPRALAQPPYCVIGDAAHAMSPQLGLGTTLAAQDALAVASAVQAHGPVDGALAYHARRRRIVQTYQTVSRALTPCFQAKYGSWARDIVFAAGLRIPGVPWLMKRSLTEPPAHETAVAAAPASEKPQA